MSRNYGKLRKQAIELRKQGWSYGMISKELEVAKSTLSGWLSDVPFEKYHPKVKQRIMAGQQAMAEARRQKYAALRAKTEAEATYEIDQVLAEGLSERELFLIGLVLYWGEGAKTENFISLTNSDPYIIQLFIAWLEHCLDVSREQLRVEVHLYPDIEIEEAEAYWAQISGIPREQFYKSQVDRRINKSVVKRGKLKYGTVHIKVTGKDTSYLHRKILVWITRLGQYVEQKMEVEEGFQLPIQ